MFTGIIWTEMLSGRRKRERIEGRKGGGFGASISSKTKEDWPPLPSMGNVVAMEEEFVVGLSPDTETVVEGSNGVVISLNQAGELLRIEGVTPSH